MHILETETNSCTLKFCLGSVHICCTCKVMFGYDCFQLMCFKTQATTKEKQRVTLSNQTQFIFISNFVNIQCTFKTQRNSKH
jgi:hypothetical protein